MVVCGLDFYGPLCARPPDAGPPSGGPPRVVLCCCCCCGCHCCCAHEWEPPGFHTTAQELQMCTFQAPALQTPPKFHEKTPRKKQKERNGGGRGKKARNFGPSTLPGPTLRGPEVVVLLCFFHLMFSFFFLKKEGQKTETPILAKVGLSKVGHPNFGQSRIGQSRYQPPRRSGVQKSAEKCAGPLMAKSVGAKDFSGGHQWFLGWGVGGRKKGGRGGGEEEEGREGEGVGRMLDFLSVRALCRFQLVFFQ